MQVQENNKLFTRPVWAEISKSRLLANYQKLCRMAGPQADVMAVVKANAYGHDVLACAPLLADAGVGAEWLGVTSADEGAAVRAVCPHARILLMSGIFPGEADAVIDQRLTPVVWDDWQLDLLEQAATARGLPSASIPVHLEIDTGMSRQGLRVLGPEISPEVTAFLQRFHSGSCLRLEAVATHFCEPEAFSSQRPNPQLAGLGGAIKAVRALGLQPQMVHAGNSSSIIAGSDRQALLDLASEAGARLMFRPGLALYGYVDRFTRDGAVWDPEGNDFAPVLAWKTQVTSLRTLQTSETAGYGHTFTATRQTRIALLPVGYADGFNRLLSNRGHVLIRGHKAAISGRVSMDQTMIDVTGIPGVTIGDEVVLLGSQGQHAITAWALADLTGTIPWEVLCAISARVPRLLVS